MENLQKALIMAGSVFMFVIAVSVGIYSYNVVREVSNSILSSSERYSMAAEYFTETTEDVERYATRAEIIMAIYSMEDIDYSPNKIKVGYGEGLSFEKSDFLTIEGKNKIESAIKNIEDKEYYILYDFSSGNNIVVYTPVPVS